jgi:transcriptional antiterminator NusG
VSLDEPKLKEIASMQNIMGMIGEKIPLKLRESDIRRILKDDTLEEHIDAKKLKYIVGENVKVTEGPFSSFVGVINDIKGDKIDVEIKIFGRNTPVTLMLNQIEKA